MIIFDLDGTLADCEHRRHFVDPSKNPNAMQDIYSSYPDGRWWDIDHYEKYYTAIEWKPDWKSFYEACDQDRPILQTIEILQHLKRESYGYPIPHIQIWSGRCESVRYKTEKWLSNHIPYVEFDELKMRPIGDNTPDDILKDRWLDQVIAEGKKIEFVFDDRPKVVRMWQRRGIFVFNCCQHDEEF